MLRRTHWLRQLEAMDPETDYEAIYRITVTYEFPWDLNQALSFALFRSFAVPSIGTTLDATGEFARRPQKRYDDTVLLLDEVSRHGLRSPEGRAAVRRVNQMHHGYAISQDDLRYVLATFVVVPKRWLDDFGWRAMTDREVEASVRYYRELGRLMGITRIPASYDDFERLLDDYERACFRFHPASRRVADATLGLLLGFYPRPAARAVALACRALMDDPLRSALGYPAPPAVAVTATRLVLRLRGTAERLLPARRTPRCARDLRWVRSYPDGYAVERLGTFPPPRTCPVRAGQHEGHLDRPDGEVPFEVERIS